MDDILAYTNGTEDEHWNTVRSNLSRLSNAGLYLDIDKCEFLCKEVKYLGFIIRAGKELTVDPSKVSAIQSWQAPTSVKGVRAWKWGPDEENAFKELKRIFASSPVLAQWDPDRDTIVEADCSGYAMGGCLSQIDDQSRLRPVAYFSKRLNSSEVNYPIHDKEMHAIVACLKEWKAELTSVAQPFTILTDHKNLSYFTTKQLLNERQVRYSETLQQFNFKLKWRPGHACDRPDALSRRQQDLPVKVDDERNAERFKQLIHAAQINTTTLNSVTRGIDTGKNDDISGATLFDDVELQQLWVNAVKTDENWRRARDAVKLGERSFPADIALSMTANISECTVSSDNILRGRENRVWVPNYEPLRTAIMQRTHDSHLTGHPGRDTMLSILLQRWFWPKMRSSQLPEAEAAGSLLPTVYNKIQGTKQSGPNLWRHGIESISDSDISAHPDGSSQGHGRSSWGFALKRGGKTFLKESGVVHGGEVLDAEIVAARKALEATLRVVRENHRTITGRMQRIHLLMDR
ncbi:hypothetical protein K3495_g11748 [Podosphaera aphanis]|nr:hypothetical protein K3495_g11748 [Podosphaera aphanis]